MVTYNGDLWAAWVGKSPNEQIWYSVWNGTKWSNHKTVPAALTTNGPALAVYKGKLYLAWTGTSTGVWYASFNGTSWSGQARVPAALAEVQTSPDLAAFNGSLYVDWIGKSSPFGVWYASFNGASWAAQARIPSSSTCGISACSQDEDNAALAVYGSKLYASWIVYCGSTPGDCFVSSAYNGSSWSAPTSTPSIGSDFNARSGTAMAVFGGRLYDAYYDNYYPYVVYTTFNGKRWSPWTKIASSFAGNPCYQPTLVSYAGNLIAAWPANNGGGCGNAPIEFASGP